MSGEGENPGFLGRWSRRKRGLDSPAEPDAAPAPAETPPPPAACPIPGLPPVDLSTLPPIEELTLGSDLAPFLRPGIPAALRSAALRRMWSLDPEIRDFIGCVEYQWDFNTPGCLPAGFASELGGDLKKLLAQAIGEPERKPEPDPAAPLPAAEPEAPLIAMAPPPAIALPPAEVSPDAEPVGPPRPSRRHGGAMPV